MRTGIAVIAFGFVVAQFNVLVARDARAAALGNSEQRLEFGAAVPLAELLRAPRPELPHPDQSPVLILTTGTTGAQKGARHDWSRLVRAVRTPDEEALGVIPGVGPSMLKRYGKKILEVVRKTRE